MIQVKAIIFFVLFSAVALGQTRLSRLVLKPKEAYELKGDILVVDSLILQDSSKIILNKLKPDNFIHAKVAIFYRGSLIDGKGVHGIQGSKGRPGISPQSPCTDGGKGTPGNDGTKGGVGTNLSFYFTEIILKGVLTIDVSGGDAGDGGTGGSGGGGGPGARPCVAGSGGVGGNGGQGGNGGNAGNTTFVSPRPLEIRSMLNENIIIRNYGGNLGLGGIGGSLGLSGLSPVGRPNMDGKSGRKGIKGKDGVQGKAGSINFQEK